MPHVIVEYTNNLNKEVNIKQLLQNMNKSLLKHEDVIPIGGLRTRAIKLDDYVVADGAEEDDAFVHVTIKLGSGRTDEQINRVCDELFQTVKDFFSPIFNERYLALSMEVFEFTRPTYKQNNIHLRYKK